MIGRLDELNQLERFYNSSKFEFLTMYGRRRIGKTTILREFAGRHKALFFSAQEKNDSLNLLDFSKMVQTFFEGSFISSFQNWEAAFEYITGKISDKKLVLIIDEFPFQAEPNPSIKSILQHTIDHVWKGKNIFLILCGSSVSFMLNDVMGYKSPLYGRITGIMEVMPFDYLESAEFFPNYSKTEKAIAYGILGGVPRYLEAFSSEISLEEKIKKLLPDAVIEKYLSGDELIASGSKPDILFLDIQMPGMDGMETAKMLRHDNEDMILIFVTAAEEYVFQAFDVGAFHYLVKPFSDEKLKEVVTKAVHNIKRSFKLEKDEKYIMVQTAGSHIKIFLRDIVYAEVYNRKVIIHTRSTDIEYYGKLQELSDMAGTDFFRTHRAYLVHFKYVEKYDATCVTMKNGTALIAKQNYPEFVKQYLKYNQRKGNEVR